MYLLVLATSDLAQVRHFAKPLASTAVLVRSLCVFLGRLGELISTWLCEPSQSRIARLASVSALRSSQVRCKPVPAIPAMRSTRSWTCAILATIAPPPSPLVLSRRLLLLLRPQRSSPAPGSPASSRRTGARIVKLSDASCPAATSATTKTRSCGRAHRRVRGRSLGRSCRRSGGEWSSDSAEAE